MPFPTSRTSANAFYSSAEDIGWLKAYAVYAPVALASNFSVGVPLILDLAAEAARKVPGDWNVSVIETHHTKKLDAPSGTAKRIAIALRQSGGACVAKGLPVEALRLGDVVGEHTVHLAGQGERIEITHKATRRSVFAKGALRLAAWLRQKKPGYYMI